MDRLQTVLTASAIRRPGGFFDRPFVQNFFPFITSLSFHAAILVLGLLTYTAIKGIDNSRPLENQRVVADSTSLNFNNLPAFTGTANLPDIRTQQDLIPNQADGSSFVKGSPLEIGTRGGGDSGAELAVFDEGNLNGVGIGGNMSGRNGTGNGKDGGDGLLAPIGRQQIGGSSIFKEPPGPVARKIAFVCDSSGSMLPKFDSLRNELSHAVSGLKPIQSFSIIFFHDEAKPVVLSAGLLRATSENKRKADEFLQGMTPGGTTDPIPGIEAAFRQNPQLIFLLTDGDFPDNDAVLRKIRELNKDRAVKVNTIAFLGAGDRDTAFLKLLQTIANENGGTFKHVQLDE